MDYLSSRKIAEKWGISERSVRNYCAQGRIPGAKRIGKIWYLPETARKPERRNGRQKKNALLEVLRREQESGLKGGIYHRVQVDLTYNSNHMEGSRLSHDQTRYIFETNTIGISEGSVNVDDIIETANHFRCIDLILRCAEAELTEKRIKQLHEVLKTGTSDAGKSWFSVGDYKKEPNEVGGRATVPPEAVPGEMKKLLEAYGRLPQKTLEDLIWFHVSFERIHPFQDGNGRVGRLILFKECLKYGIVPFIISDDLKLFYYRGLAQWDREKGYLMDACLTAQDRFKAYLDYFRIEYEKNS